MDLRDLSGRIAGAFLSPLTGAVALVRGARTFHPEGAVYRAQVAPLAEGGALGRLAKNLSGDALVRLSTAWWRSGREWPDVLGCAVRFGGNQDLLTATVRSPWTTLLAPATTEQHDFLANDYYGVSPFDLIGVGEAKLRLRSLYREGQGSDRGEKLARAAAEDRAVLRLEAELYSNPKEWIPIAEIRLREELDLDQETLRFSPFRAGRGIAPKGFVHSMRRATYALSQLLRPQKMPPKVA